MDWTESAFEFIGRGVEMGLLLSLLGWGHRLIVQAINTVLGR